MKMSEMEDDELQQEYDFSNSERAPYAALAGDVHIVALDGDVWQKFPDSQTVNAALRGLMSVQTPEVLPKAS